MKKFLENQFGQKVVACCASCAFHGAHSEEQRVCKNGKGIVPKGHLCDDYKMTNFLNNAGTGGGKVKRREYLEWLASVRGTRKESVSELCAEWERKNGSSYI